ncbi:MAG: N-acetylmuramoyl-L-alanine amidase [Alphaproteobacteria bacterium]|nr:N-acetylmuramoyl-L-alanine amidase [Alphaproteobacteria bacterium]
MPVLIFILLVLTGGDAFALSVDQMRFGAHPGKTRLVLDLSGTSQFKAYAQPDPYRLVIDLPAATVNPGIFPKSSGAGIKKISAENAGGMLRIVLETAGPVTIQSAFALPRGQGKPDRLVIDFSAISAAGFRNQPPQAYNAERENTPVTEATLKLPEPKKEPPPAKAFDKKPLVIIDPGHGGDDPGASGPGSLKEKHVTLALGRELKKQLEETGRYRVLMTRESDFFIPLRERVAFARDHGGDLFISIHADSIDKAGVRGMSIYTLSEKASDAQAAKLADRENKADLIAGIDLSTEDKDVANILVDLAMRDTMNQSAFFAKRTVDICRAQSFKLLDKPYRQAGFAVLKAPDIPSVLVETGFMSNAREAQLLNSPEYRQKIAGILRQSIDAYFERLYKNRRI